MKSPGRIFEEYKKQMKIGDVPTAYKAIIKYVMNLRTYFKTNYPDYIIGSLYQGYMDITFFSITTSLLKKRKLKIAVVFDHQKSQFEFWLSGQNRQIREENSKLLEKKGQKEYYASPTNPYSIIEYTIAENPNFGDVDSLTIEIEKGFKKFLQDIVNTLS